MDTKVFRKLTGLTQKEFSVLFSIPYATVRNWDARDSMPDYTWKLIDDVLLYRYLSFLYDVLLPDERASLTNDQLKEKYNKLLKDEAQELIQEYYEKAL